MTLSISREQACRLLTLYHFAPTDLAGVFERLGTVQYDPLNPVGRNPDLVLQARVPGYQVDDWQQAAYTERLIYDSWDKQACLVPSSDWPWRALVREMYRPYHDREILQAETEAAGMVLATIDARGPLSSLEFEDQSGFKYPTGSWYGSTQVKRLLRALWSCGQLVTHHRKAGRHYYDRPERVIPTQHFVVPAVLDKATYHRWVMARRHQAAGMLRPTAEAAIWSACGNSAERKQAIRELVEADELTLVHVGEKDWPYYMLTSTLKLLDAPLSPTWQPQGPIHPTMPPPATTFRFSAPRMIFLGPLDSLLWDRKALMQLFDFDYIWEVYKPEPLRKWGYYVLPVFYRDRFVARVDSRLEKGIWRISRWWWEQDVVPDAEMLDALRAAVERFVCYLRADGVWVGEDVDVEVRQAVLGDGVFSRSTFVIDNSASQEDNHHRRCM